MVKLLLLVVGIVVGVLVMLQARVAPSRVVNPVEPYSSLVDLRTQLESDQKSLRSRLEQASDRRNQIEKQLKQTRADAKLLDEIERIEVAVGFRPVSGPGIVITLDDARKGQPTVENIVHASDLRDVVNTAWLLGASAVSVNGQRITASSSIDSSASTIMVNNQRVTNPFVLKAIGDPAELAQKLNNHSILAVLRKRAAETGLLYHTEQSKHLEVEPYHGSLKPEVAEVSDGQ